ncbi:hypothetical protein EMCG_08826 [[Emmonsia] crescens]|uniref:Major facilitator superfamily (MFS) profile domain-containing protein n=1 Tax=[Emmonsia] crescens TaxID=73230 RepID=A0A0G2I4Y4_9EURO|nr:hypothetical protein EMCG_08826 [Emmonsia crescens UAMH 3008]
MSEFYECKRSTSTDLGSCTSIASDLKGTAVEAFWVGTSFLLTYAVFQPLITVVSDIFGRREVMLVSVTLFTAGSLIACLAQKFSTLLAGRSIQGVGAGGVFVLGYVILTDIVPLRQRPKFTAIIQIAWAIGTILGPLVGGLFAEHTTWRWTFYINFPFCVIGFVMVPIAYNPSPNSNLLGRYSICMGSHRDFRSYDTRYIWNLVYDLGLELYIALYYIPLNFQAVKEQSPVRTGISALPITSSLVPASVFVAAIIARTGQFRWAIWVGWVLTTLSTGLLLLLNTDTKTAVWATVLIFLGFGHGLILSALNLGVQAISTVSNVAHAVMMYSFL